jgi:hypothetical protein
MPLRFRAAVLTVALTINAADTVSVSLVDKPATVAVPVPKTAGRAKALLLQLEHVIAPKSAAATFNIFVDLPSADATTPVDHPNFVGYVTMLPNPSAPNNPAKGITMQMAEPAARLVRTERTARLTFVPTEPLAEGGVKIGSIRIEPVVH